MKPKIILLFIVFVVFAQALIAQTNYRGKLEFDLSVDQTEWNVGSRIIAKVTVKNISNESIKITIRPNFQLAKKGIPTEDLRKWGGILESGERMGNNDRFETRQTFKTSLDKNKSKTFEFELSSLAWNDTISSIERNNAWYNTISKGEYELYYNFRFSWNEGNDESPFSTIVSNKIGVKLNSLQ